MVCAALMRLAAAQLRNTGCGVRERQRLTIDALPFLLARIAKDA